LDSTSACLEVHYQHSADIELALQDTSPASSSSRAESREKQEDESGAFGSCDRDRSSFFVLSLRLFSPTGRNLGSRKQDEKRGSGDGGLAEPVNKKHLAVAGCGSGCGCAPERWFGGDRQARDELGTLFYVRESVCARMRCHNICLFCEPGTDGGWHAGVKWSNIGRVVIIDDQLDVFAHTIVTIVALQFGLRRDKGINHSTKAYAFTSLARQLSQHDKHNCLRVGYC
jgi:hypothetical protein